MTAKQYVVTASNPGCMLFEGQTVAPYYEDDQEIILDIPGQSFSHHIRKHGAFFDAHLKPAGGQ